MACYSAGDEPDGAEHGRAASVIGVYSPVGRCLKTSFALTLGQLMAADRRVLYVTLEDYSGLASMTGEEYKSDFSDILYYFSQGNLNFMRLSGIVHSIGNMDYIPPARYPEDLAHIPAEQMADLSGSWRQTAAMRLLFWMWELWTSGCADSLRLPDRVYADKGGRNIICKDMGI